MELPRLVAGDESAVHGGGEASHCASISRQASAPVSGFH